MKALTSWAQPRNFVRATCSRLFLAQLLLLSLGCGGSGGDGLCQRLNFTAGFDPDPPTCGGSPLPVRTTLVTFDPADPRWADQYQACLASAGCTFCNGECAEFCRTVAAAEGIDPTGAEITSCSLSCTVENQLLMTKPTAACGG